MTLRETLSEIRLRGGLPERGAYQNLLECAITVLEHEDAAVRPPDSTLLPGGLLRLKTGIPTLVIPDLHARTDFFMHVMDWRVSESSTVLEALERDELQILCLGDGFHSEKRGQLRWLDAFREYSHGYRKHKQMDREMGESFALMEMVMQCKRAFRQNFHFLKGNHENILNEEGHGNHPFRKYSYEGEMVREFVLKFYGSEFLEVYALFEKSLPLFAVGGNFLASHSEPLSFFSEDDLIETRSRPDVILGLTWTDNDASGEGTVAAMLDHYLPGVEDTVYFGGHRPVPGLYRYRALNRYIQIHNPDKEIIALVESGRRFDADTDIREIQEGEICGRDT
jgi:hypothetical protein